jgi:hypothetical protein
MGWFVNILTNLAVSRTLACQSVKCASKKGVGDYLKHRKPEGVRQILSRSIQEHFPISEKHTVSQTKSHCNKLYVYEYWPAWVATAKYQLGTAEWCCLSSASFDRLWRVLNVTPKLCEDAYSLLVGSDTPRIMNIWNVNCYIFQRS